MSPNPRSVRCDVRHRCMHTLLVTALGTAIAASSHAQSSPELSATTPQKSWGGIAGGPCEPLCDGDVDHNGIIDVNDLTINESGITIKAETSGYEAAATIESAIQSNERFKSAKKAEETKKGDKLHFAISIPFDVEETEEEG